MNNLDQDFVNPLKPQRSTKARRGWNGHWTDLSAEADDRNHFVLSKLYRPGTDREEKLAELCCMDMHSAEWNASLRWLCDHGYINWVRKVWDGVHKVDWVDLPDDRRVVKLMANGLHFASQTLAQLRRE